MLEPLFECIFDEVYTYVKQNLSPKMEVLECNVIKQVTVQPSQHNFLREGGGECLSISRASKVRGGGSFYSFQSTKKDAVTESTFSLLLEFEDSLSFSRFHRSIFRWMAMLVGLSHTIHTSTCLVWLILAGD